MKKSFADSLSKIQEAVIFDLKKRHKESSMTKIRKMVLLTQ